MERVARSLVEMDERSLVEPDWVGLALEDAQDWVRKVRPHQWKRFFADYDIIAKREGNEGANTCARFADLVDGIKRFHDHTYEHEEYINLMWDHDIDYSILECEKIYNAAWMAYVLQVRQMYEEYRAAKQEQILSERREAWKAIIPELPPQLRD